MLMKKIYTKFEDPQELWDAAMEYFEFASNQTVDQEDYVGKEAKRITRKTAVPFTFAALCLFIECSEKYFLDFKKSKTL